MVEPGCALLRYIQSEFSIYLLSISIIPMRDAQRSLAQLDLNLLVTLDALLAERNVTRAARRLGSSQPAVSVQLAKLREALQDPLLLPGPRGMAPTSAATALEGPLREALHHLAQVIAP